MQSARQQLRLAEDLEAVADAHDQAAVGGEAATASMIGLKRAMAPQRR